MKKLLVIIILLASAQCYAENITLKADPQPTGCRAGTTCNIAAVHSISLQNTSGQQRTYGVTYQICADNGDCKKHVYYVPVAPTHTWSHTYTLNLFTVFNRAHPHTIQYWTTVSSEWVNQQYNVSGNVDVK